MSSIKRLDRLYQLVPEIYRQRDEVQGYPLRALLRVITEQVAVLEDNLDELYDDWFIETCREQLVPYLGELVGYRPSEEIGDTGTVDDFEGRLRQRLVTPRREVARAVALRRRKGTPGVLDDVAVDVTGWPARAVEFRTLLVVAQNVRHLHLERGRTVDVRAGRALERLGGPFDVLAHTVDVRNVDAVESPGRTNIPSVGLFMWRIPGFSVTRSQVYRHERAGNPEDGCYSFNVLGIDTPLYTRASAGVTAMIEGPADTPMRLTRREFAVEAWRYVGPGKSFELFLDGKPATNKIVPANLSQWAFPVPLEPTEGLKRPILVDPELGRFMILGMGRRELTSVRATWHYGLSAAIGGGEYERATIDPQGAKVYRVSSDPGDLPTLTAALGRWEDDKPSSAIIELWESDVYTDKVEIVLPQGKQLMIRAGEGKRPVLRILDERPDLRDAFLVRAGTNTRFTLDGIMITGRSMRVEGKLRRLELRHCTLVPTPSVQQRRDESSLSEASLQLDELSDDAEVTIDHCILGPIVVEDRGELLPISICDSIVDALGDRSRAIWSGRAGSRVAAHVALTVHHSTVFGEVHAHVIALADGSIFTGCVHADRRQQGCMRFSSIHCGEATPRRFRCQPDLAIEQASLDAAAELQQLEAAVAKAEAEAVKAEAEAAKAKLEAAKAKALAEKLGTDESKAAAEAAQAAAETANAKLAAANAELETANTRLEAVKAEPDESRARRAARRVKPVFVSRRYGDPEYARLADHTDPAVLRGAADESEIGVFHDLFTPQRMARLRDMLREFVPADAEVGVIPVT